MITSRVLAEDQINLSGEEERDSSGFVNKLKEFTAFAWGLGKKLNHETKQILALAIW